jgi:hypothetical protein
VCHGSLGLLMGASVKSFGLSRRPRRASRQPIQRKPVASPALFHSLGAPCSAPRLH